jgi:hypothetical protein
MFLLYKDFFYLILYGGMVVSSKKNQ